MTRTEPPGSCQDPSFQRGLFFVVSILFIALVFSVKIKEPCWSMCGIAINSDASQCLYVETTCPEHYWWEKP